MKRGKNFTQRLFLTYSIVILALLLILFAGVFFMVYSDREQKEINAQQELVSKTQQQIDMSLQNMDRIVNGLLYNKSFMQIMRDNDIASSYTRYSAEVLDTIVSLDAPLFLTHRVIAFNRENYFTFTKTGEDQAHILRAILEYADYDRLLDADGDKVILPVHNDPFGIADMPVYSVARTITDGINTFGVIEVQSDYERLKEFCAIDAQLGEILLLSGQGDVIYPWNAPGQTDFARAIYDIIEQKGGGDGHFQWEGHQISYSVSPYSGWITVMHCPVSYLLPDASLLWIFALSFLAASVIMLSLVRLVAAKVARPLSELERSIKQVSLENLSMEMPVYAIAEIENITRSFQGMLEHLRVEIARNEEARAGEERAKYVALQSQMNPHTIYNTITMIEAVAYMNGDYEASALCISFTQMLRYISDNTQDIYTVADEVRHLNNYAALIKKRYEGRLVIDIAVQEALLSQIIPKFTLQPLVENAVQHGMNRESSPFRVSVAIDYTDDGWQVAVSDNGNGFTEEKLAEALEGFRRSDDRLQGNAPDLLHTRIDNMALNNIYTRWRMKYGHAFSIRIENTAPGCRIVLAIKEEPA